jgi:ketosteroid isomerase-like protein
LPWAACYWAPLLWLPVRGTLGKAMLLLFAFGEGNDDATMDKILADDFVLVIGSGKAFNKADLLADARSRSSIYEHQEDTERTVRVWGDTAVVKAKLWIKGTRDGRPIDYTLWFSDTYVRTPVGWRYVFGQAFSAAPE